MDRRVKVGTTCPEGLSLRGDDLTLIIPRGGWATVTIQEAIKALMAFDHIYCPDLLVPKPEPRFIGKNEIVPGPEGIPTDRSRFALAFAGLLNRSDLRALIVAAENAENLGDPDFAVCVYCQGEINVNGMHRHVSAKHPEHFQEWKAMLGDLRTRSLSSAPAAPVTEHAAPPADDDQDDNEIDNDDPNIVKDPVAPPDDDEDSQEGKSDVAAQ